MTEKNDGLYLYHLEQIFGTGSKEIVKSYVVREDVDSKFKRELENSNKHIVIYGGSKQGKSSLIKHFHYKFNNSVTIQMGSHIRTPEDLYRNLYDLLDVKIESEQRVSNTLSGNVEIAAGLKVPLIGGAETKLDGQSGRETEKIYTSNPNIYIDPSLIKKNLVQLGKLPEFIIVENYHFACKNLLEKFAEDLRTWNDLSLRFIILGVFKNQDELQLRENNLRGRITYISVDHWNDEDLQKVIEKGTKLLKVSLDEKIREQFVQGCINSVGLLQEIVCLFFRSIMFLKPQEVFTKLSYGSYEVKVTETFSELTKDYQDIFRFLKALSQKSKSETFYLNYWLVLYLYDNAGEEWAKGIKTGDLVDFTQSLIKKNKESRLNSPEEFININWNSGLDTTEENIRKCFEKGLASLNEESRSISKENNIFFDNHKVYIVNAYLVFYLKNCYYEQDIEEISSPW